MENCNKHNENKSILSKLGYECVGEDLSLRPALSQFNQKELHAKGKCSQVGVQEEYSVPRRVNMNTVDHLKQE